MSGEKTRKPKIEKQKVFKIKSAVVSKYFSKEQTQAEIEDIIDKALSLYFAEETEQT